MADIIDRELSWDDEINQEGGFIVLAPGEYPFTVKGYERSRSQGSDKLPPSNMAIVEIEVGGTTVKEFLIMHTKAEWKLSQFFISIGMKKKGEPLRMNWPGVIGKTGMCKIKNETREGKTYNRIEEFLEPKQQAVTQPQFTAQQPGFNPGGFNPTGF